MNSSLETMKAQRALLRDRIYRLSGEVDSKVKQLNSAWDELRELEKNMQQLRVEIYKKKRGL